MAERNQQHQFAQTHFVMVTQHAHFMGVQSLSVDVGSVGAAYVGNADRV
jgi:hypothetical protein